MGRQDNLHHLSDPQVRETVRRMTSVTVPVRSALQNTVNNNNDHSYRVKTAVSSIIRHDAREPCSSRRLATPVNTPAAYAIVKQAILCRRRHQWQGTGGRFGRHRYAHTLHPSQASNRGPAPLPPPLPPLPLQQVPLHLPVRLQVLVKAPVLRMAQLEQMPPQLAPKV